MHADIYIASSLRGMRRQDGVVGFVAEAQTSGGPATLTRFGAVTDATPYHAELIGMKLALERIKPECRITFHMDGSYIAAAVEKGWVHEWEKGGWKTSRGTEVAHRTEWEAVLGLLGGRQPGFKVGTDHKYKRWLHGELDRRMRKHVESA